METTEKVTTTYRKYIIRHAPFFPDLFSYFVVSKSMKDCVASICLELWFLHLSLYFFHDALHLQANLLHLFT